MNHHLGGPLGGREGGREEGREGGRKGGREEGREGGRKEGRKVCLGRGCRNVLPTNREENKKEETGAEGWWETVGLSKIPNRLIDLHRGLPLRAMH